MAKSSKSTRPATGSSSRPARVPTGRERAAQLKLEQAAAEKRRARFIWIGATVLVLAIVGTVAAVVVNDQRNRPSLEAVASFTYEGGRHVETPVTYAESPPVGGEHNPVWLNCGIYDAAVANENAVHSLEHGAVWITYKPDLPAADIEKLREVTPSTYAILSPFEGLTAPAVVSAWGKQLTLTSVDDPRLTEFIKTYRQGPQTPEPGAACTGGTGTPIA